MAVMTSVDAPGATQTWQDVYETHSVAEVKVLEKQLRSSVLRDKEKLRVLVGEINPDLTNGNRRGNYRELLSTADEIVALESRSRETETKIADLSSKCQPPELSTVQTITQQPAETAVQLRLLSQCILCATDKLRSRSLLLSAQLCLIARLLLKSLTTSDQHLKVVERSRAHAEDLRQKLLRRIDTQLVHPRSSTKTMTEACCAFSLVKSVSSADAIEHFRNLRLSILRQRFESDSYSSNHIRESYRYLILSVQSLRSLLSRGVNDVLAGLQRQPILEDPAISRIEALGLDAIRMLVPADVLTFTPYVKRVVLQKDDISHGVQTWITAASKIASEGLARAMQSVKGINEILSIRKHLLDIVLPVCFSTNAQGALLESIRGTTNDKLIDLCKLQNEAVLNIVRTMLSQSSNAAPSTSIWEDSFIERPLVANSSDFLQQVQNRHLGTTGSLQRSLKRLRSWTQSCKTVQDQLQEIRQIRWQDVIEEADEDEEDAAAKIVETLSKNDPSQLESFVDNTTRKAITTLETQMEQHVSDSLASESASTTQTVYLLRALRETSAIITQSLPTYHFNLGKAYTKLHEALAAEVLRRLASNIPSLDSASSSTVVADGLPSPRCVATLRDLCLMMEDIGGADIWSAPAVKVLKSQLRKEMFSDSKKQWFIENEFDEHYLGAALGAAKSSQETGSTAEAAIAYWQRTKLLFGSLTW